DGQASQLYEALRCQKKYHLFPTAEGGGGHCQAGATSNLHQVIFDWLDALLASVATSTEDGSHRPART
ncbi:MAG: hypothetical protein ABSG43_24205, partial [Solirubrobacteraceae bacterium]